MDFVLLGFGLGALLVLLGRAVRTYGPWIKRKNRVPSTPRPAFAAALRWGRVCRASGLLITLTGIFLCCITVILLLLDASDWTGMVVLSLSLVAAVLLSGVWAALFAHPEWRRMQRSPRRDVPRQAISTLSPSRSEEHAQSSVSETALAAWPAPSSRREGIPPSNVTTEETDERPEPAAPDDRGSGNSHAASPEVASDHSPEPRDAEPARLPAASRMR